MKKLKTIAAFLLAATLLFAATHAAFAIAIIDEDGNIVQENEELPGGIMTLDADIGDWDIGDWDLADDFETGDYQLFAPRFDFVTGEVVEINDSEDGTKMMRVRISQNMDDYEGETQASYVDFRIDMNTFIMGVTDEPGIGDTVTGFFETNGPAILIYPPQHLATVIVNRGYAMGGLPRVIVDRFDSDWTSANYRLNIGDETEIVFQDGTPFTGEIEELIGRKLAVEFHISHRDIPETIPNPERVTILFERAVHPTIEIDLGAFEVDQGVIWDLVEYVNLSPSPFDAWFHLNENWVGYTPDDDVDLSEYAIIITLNGLSRGVPNASGRVVNDDNGLGWPDYVPLRAVTEMLGITPEWNDTPYRQIVVQSPRGEISMHLGSPYYSLRSHEGLVAVYTTYTLAPPLIFDGRTYVPLAFFRDVYGFTNAYFEGGHIKIDNAERME